jgi:hypothetical protein
MSTAPSPAPSPAPAPPTVPGKKGIAQRALAALVSAVTSPEAIKAEKNLAVLVVARVALAVGASAGLVALITKLAS